MSIAAPSHREPGRIFVHDYAGHPFQIQLSRELAHRGYEVVHAYCASLRTTPRGELTRRAADPATLTILPIELGRALNKTNFFARWLQENEYGRLLAAAVARHKPDVVLSGNTPLDAQRRLWNVCVDGGVAKAFWVQDLIGEASRRLLSRKIPLLGSLVGSHYRGLEQKLLRQSDAVVTIAEDFRAGLRAARVDDNRITVIENWAPVEDMPVGPKTNPWSIRHDLANKPCLIYSGTLAMKHNPELLKQLAVSLQQSDARLVVVSNGSGADWLAKQKENIGLDALDILGFQAFEDLPHVLASADVLVGILERDAGAYSVPSKVLSYMCAARPILLAVPGNNLASRLVSANRAGMVFEPDDVAGFVEGARQLLASPKMRSEMGQNGREYAARTFEVGGIADRFEAVLSDAFRRASAGVPT